MYIYVYFYLTAVAEATPEGSRHNNCEPNECPIFLGLNFRKTSIRGISGRTDLKISAPLFS